MKEKKSGFIKNPPKDSQARSRFTEAFSEALKQNIMKNVNDSTIRYLESRWNTFEKFKQAVEINVKEFENAFKKYLSKQIAELGGASAIHGGLQDRIIDNYIEQLPIIFPNQSLDFMLITLPLLLIQPDMDPQEIKQGKRIFGGCGMELKVQKVQPSPKAELVWQSNWSKMMALESETWKKVKSDSGVSGYLFRLFYEDVPSWQGNHYEEMEALLMSTDDKDVEGVQHWFDAMEAMHSGKTEDFKKMLNEHPHLQSSTDAYGCTLLHHAVLMEDDRYANLLLSDKSAKKTHLEATDHYGYIPLHYAAMGKTPKILELMIKEDKTKVHAQSKNGVTPLIVAIQDGNFNNAKMLLAAGAKNVRLAGGYNALHCALHHGHEGIARLLIESKIIDKEQLNLCAEEGGTPLMLACELDSLPIVECLMRNGANPSIERRDGLSALEIALRRNCKPVVEFLVSQSIPTDRALSVAAKECSLELVQIISKHPKFYGFRNGYQGTVLHMAIRYANLPVALYLSEQMSGPVLEEKNKGGETPLGLSISAGCLELIEALMKKGVKINTLETCKSLMHLEYHPLLKTFLKPINFNPDQLQILLKEAAEWGHHETISLVLIPKGAELSKLKGPNGWTILHYLAKCDGIFLFKREMTKIQDLLLRDDTGKTLAYIAAQHGSLRVLSYLLEEMKKRSLPLKDHFNDSHLLYGAIQSGKEACVKLVFDIYKDDNLAKVEIDAESTRPVHLAAKIGSKAMLRLFGSKGANFKVVDRQGYSPLYYAIRAGSLNVIKFLIHKGKVPISDEDFYGAASQMMGPIWDLVLKQCLADHTIDTKGKEAVQIALHQDNSLAMARLASLGLVVDDEIPETQAPWIDAFKKMLEEKDLGKLKNVVAQLPVSAMITIISDGKKVTATAFQHVLSACKKVDKSMLDDVLQKGGDPNRPDSQGNTWAHLLVMANYSPVGIRGIQLDKKNNKGQTPLHLAALKNSSHPDSLNALGSLDELGSLEGLAALASGMEVVKPNILKELLDVLSAKDVNCQDRMGRSPLFYAIQKQSKENVELLIQKKADLNLQDFTLISPLFLSCRLGDLSIVKLLVQNGAYLNQPSTFEHLTPLCVSLKSENDEMALYLLMNGANGSMKTVQGIYPIHLASAKGKLNLMRFFAAKGQSLELPDYLGLQPIHHAAMKGKTDVIEELISLGVPIDSPAQAFNLPNKKKKEIQAFTGATPLFMASRDGQVSTVEWLLNHHADPEICTDQKMNVLSAATNSTLLLETLRKYKFTENPSKIYSAILSAIIRDNVDTMRTLFEWGISIDAPIEEGITSLHWASRFGSLQCTQFLLDRGANPFVRNHLGETPLELAAANNSVEQFRLMLEHCSYQADFDLAQPNIRGETLVHLAAKAGNISHLICLILEGASLDVTDVEGSTPIHLALRERKADVLPLLVACGADLNAKSANGMKAVEMIHKADLKTIEKFNHITQCLAEAEKNEPRLHFAIRTGDYPSILLLTHLELVNQQDSKGRTPLHLAVLLHQWKTLRLLITQRALLNQIDQEGHTPLWLACFVIKDPKMARFLIKAGADTKPVLEELKKADFPEKERVLQAFMKKPKKDDKEEKEEKEKEID